MKKKHASLSGTFLGLALITQLCAQPQLVKDINTATASSDPVKGAVLGSLYITSMSNATAGQELWATDGTSAGTYLVKDIQPGNGSSSPAKFTTYNGYVYFVADNGVHGTELWRTDGTAAGTGMVMNIDASGSSYPNYLTVFNGKLYFAAYESSTGTELWSTDGTTTAIVADLNTTGSTNPAYLCTLGTSLFFSGEDAALGNELFRYDGTTTTVIDINPGGTAYVEDITVSGSYIYFSADNGTTGQELFRHDGVTLSLASDIFTGGYGSDPTCFVPYGTGVAFVALGNYSVGREWFYFDGTTATMLGDINPGGNYCTYATGVADAGVVNGRLVFGANNGTQEELWISDGTPGGTALVEVNPSGNSYPVNFSPAFGGYIYFRAQGADGYELYRTDGTNTSLMLNISLYDDSDPEQFALFGTQLLFAADNGINGKELWSTDGTTGGTAMIADVMNNTLGSSISRIRTGNNFLTFGAEESMSGAELFLSDGTTAGTYMPMDINPGAGSGFYDEVAVNGSWVFFAGNDGVNGTEPWKSDGTSTQMLMDIDPSGDGDPYNFVAAGAWTYFTAYDPSYGYELWKTDGSTTSMVKDINPGAGSSYPAAGVEMGGYYFFACDDGTNGTELWKTDGTAAGTTLIANVNPSTYNELDIVVTNGVLVFFVADNGTSGYEMFATDGTNTFLVSDINPGGNDSDIDNVAVIGNWIYFGANDGTHGQEPWRTDGLTTLLVMDVNTSGDSDPAGFSGLNLNVFFSANDGMNGRELWKTDGISTSMVADILPGAGDAYPEGMTAYFGKVYFSANNGVNGYELWSSDGTGTGTQLVHEFIPGPAHSSPRNFTVLNNVLYFTAGADSVGNELWKYIPPTTITNSGLAGNICQTTYFTVAFTANGLINAGNIYTAEISDNTGSFAAPTVIGTLASTATTGFINLLIPQSVASGNGYRIRVNASNPASTGTDNGYNLNLIGSPALTLTAADSSVCAGSGLVALTGAPSGGSWSGTGVSGSDFDPVSAGTGMHAAYYYYMDQTSGCANTDSLLLTVHALPQVTAGAAFTSVCVDDAAVALNGTPSAGSWSGAGVSGTQLDPSAAGNGTHYAVYSFTHANGCSASDSVAITVDACVGIQENNTNAVSIYPNPNNGLFVVETDANASVVIYNSTGERVLTATTNSTRTEIDLTPFADGLYHLAVIKDGSVICTISVSKQ